MSSDNNSKKEKTPEKAPPASRKQTIGEFMRDGFPHRGSARMEGAFRLFYFKHQDQFQNDFQAALDAWLKGES